MSEETAAGRATRNLQLVQKLAYDLQTAKAENGALQQQLTGAQAELERVYADRANGTYHGESVEGIVRERDEYSRELNYFVLERSLTREIIMLGKSKDLAPWEDQRASIRERLTEAGFEDRVRQAMPYFEDLYRSLIAKKSFDTVRLRLLEKMKEQEEK